MVSSDWRNDGRLGGLQRWFALVAGLGLLTLLIVAACLTPNAQGSGTHQQLGLPPCSFRVLFEYRCAACGMTTSWSHLVRGNLIQSLKSNVGGTLLGVLAVLSVPWLTVSAVKARWIWRPPNDWFAVWMSLTVLAVTLVDWCIRLVVL